MFSSFALLLCSLSMTSNKRITKLFF